MTFCGMSSTQIVGSHQFSCMAKDSSNTVLTISSPAKLNVFLEVSGKRPDDYHELETVMLRTSLADQLTIRRTDSESLTLRFSDATPESMRVGIPLDGQNLILRAAEAVRKRVGSSSGAEFILHKRIPPESGLAGGSGNAAAALLGCRQLWKETLPDAELHEIAATLGSDINFLLSGHRAAVCRGRGEIVEPIALNRRLYFVAVRPRRGNSTAEVFRAATLPKTGPGLRPLLLAGRDEDAISEVPVGHRLLHRHADIAHPGRSGELQPGAFYRRAMHVPAPSAGDDRRQSF